MFRQAFAQVVSDARVDFVRQGLGLEDINVMERTGSVIKGPLRHSLRMPRRVQNQGWSQWPGLTADHHQLCQ
jgi:hypothetical protein